MDYKIKNAISEMKRELSNIDETEYEEIYNTIENKDLSYIFSKIHKKYIDLFGIMNKRLPTKDEGNHFRANPSRGLLNIINLTNNLKRRLNRTGYEFFIDEEYNNIINKCEDFLTESGGSTIPPHMGKIELYYEQPIFVLKDKIQIKESENEKFIKYENLKLIGHGSYAKVFKYKDSFYNKYFVVKRANSELEEKEMKRFKKEYETLKKFNSPYIVEAYFYDDNKGEYVMEFVNHKLYDYIKKRPNLSLDHRKNIGLQIIKGLEYIHSKGYLHRDLSFSNILIKEYETTYIVKLCDFGLVKEVNSTLTSNDSILKGSLNDPSLRQLGFGNYSLVHEIYALTLLLNYLITGKENPLNTDERTKKFVDKGTHADTEIRYQTLDEIKKAFIYVINIEDSSKEVNTYFSFTIDERDIDIYKEQKKHLLSVKQCVKTIKNNDSAIHEELLIDLNTFIEVYGDNDPTKIYRDQDLRNMVAQILENISSFITIINNNRKYNANQTFKFRPYDDKKESDFCNYAREINRAYNFIVKRMEDYI